MDDENSCLFLTKYKLIRVNCPFEVITAQDTISWNKGEKVVVDLVKEWDYNTLLFQVKGKLYPHRFFYYKPPTSLVIKGLKKG
ncbi:hypothetical protein [Adhaeribacter soli]|uniref:Uncharacterized protein n=1 Tax=Adhaeribacter soli TaxID=2607655 RepID=A0A5N1IM46_9BACT|nr:hypothetical protein [Adhaeribacter soli]KAA9331142.1 hypothetical protein F0P94_14700 [Adhaeribacter soli]